jgi:CRP/FNR family transcriptional activator FtrB
MHRTDRDHIRALPLFRPLTQHHFDALLRAGFLQRCPARLTLVTEGEMPDFLHVVLQGAVELYSSYKGRETTTDIISPIATFILASVIGDDVYLTSARTLTPAQILMIPADMVRKIFSVDPAFARAVATEIAKDYRHIVRALKDQKLRSGMERLANWILETDRRHGYRGRIHLTHEKRTLAARLGMTPENLSRNLARLSDYGVSGRGRDIVITDRKALRHWAKPDPFIDG